MTRLPEKTRGEWNFAPCSHFTLIADNVTTFMSFAGEKYFFKAHPPFVA